MRRTIVALLLCSVSAAALAAQLKPGLWEMSIESDALKAMPKLSEAQMAQMKSLGIAMPQMQNGAMQHKVCVTKEMAARNELPQADSNPAGCELANVQNNSDGYSADLVCKSEIMKGAGKIRGSFAGDTFTSTSDFKGTSYGRPVNDHTRTRGKWLAADCGGIKPMPLKH